jgi:hypothetical protein
MAKTTVKRVYPNFALPTTEHYSTQVRWLKSIFDEAIEQEFLVKDPTREAEDS